MQYKKLFGEHARLGASPRSTLELQSPVRDPYTDALLGTLAALEARWPIASRALQLGSVLGLNALFVALCGLNAAVAGVSGAMAAAAAAGVRRRGLPLGHKHHTCGGWCSLTASC